MKPTPKFSHLAVLLVASTQLWGFAAHAIKKPMQEARLHFKATVNSSEEVAPGELIKTSNLRMLLGECYQPNLTEESNMTMRVNGIAMSPAHRANFLYLAHCVMPVLPGTKEERAKLIANAAWWSIREDVWGFKGANLFRYSSCTEQVRATSGHLVTQDVSHAGEPGFRCQSAVWQVGIGAVQAKNRKLYLVEGIANTLKDSLKNYATQHGFNTQITDADILEWTSHLAAFDTYGDQIIHSKGWLRASWLLRNPWIAVMAAQAEVHECYLCSNGDSFNSRNFSGSDLKGDARIQDRQQIIGNTINDLTRIALEIADGDALDPFMFSQHGLTSDFIQ
jgi:hypothetical protein